MYRLCGCALSLTDTSLRANSQYLVLVKICDNGLILFPPHYVSICRFGPADPNSPIRRRHGGGGGGGG